MGLKYGERGISEAMVPTESAGRHWGIRLTSRRGSWRWQELCVGGGGFQGLPRTHGWQQLSRAPHRPQQPRSPPSPPRLPRPRITRASPVCGCARPTPTSAGPRGRSGLRGLLGTQRAAHRPTPWRCPYPIPARRAARDRAAGRGQAEA